LIEQPYSELSNEQLLALCAWREADSQGDDGMRGVAHVIKNRADHPSWWGVDIPSVILKPWQISSFNHGDAGEHRWPADNNTQWQAAQFIAEDVLDGSDTDLTEGATNYYDVSIEPPGWTVSMVLILSVGRLRFYRDAKPGELFMVSNPELGK
jgi:N-acetylmuramoyl-L-alanine amidase